MSSAVFNDPLTTDNRVLSVIKGNGGHPYISGYVRRFFTENEFCSGDAFPRGCPSASCMLHGCRSALSQWNCGRAAAEYIGYQPPRPVAVSQMSDETYAV